MKVKLSKRKVFTVAVFAVLAVLITISCLHYFRFVTQARDREVSNQLSEVFGQTNTQLNNFAAKNWSLLTDGALAFTLTEDEDKIDGYIANMKEQWGFNSWAFINEDGVCLGTSGDKGYLNLGEDWFLLINEHKSIVVDGTLAGSEPAMIFAIPTEKSTYRGFEFCAIALVYNKETMSGFLDTNSSYGGNARCYLAYPDGRMVMALKNDNSGSKNVYNMLKKAEFHTSDYETVHDGIQSGKSDCFRYAYNGEESYFYYQPVGFQDWMMIGIVPTDSVGQYATRIVNQTAFMTTVVGFMLVLALAVLFFQFNRTTIRRKNNELLYRDELFEILAGNSSNIFIVARAEDFAAEYVSSNTERVLGITPEEIKKNIPEAFLKVQDESQYNRCMEITQGLDIGEMGKHQVLRRNINTGKSMWFEDFIYHVKFGDIERYIYLLFDNTSERESREHLQTALDIAKTANESKSAFLSNMSHDIRTPMNVIIGFLPLLRRDAKDPEKVLEYTGKISTASHHLLGIINDVLDMSKIESGKTSVDMTKFRISEVVEGLTSVIRPQTNAKQQSFKVIVRDVRSEYLEGDTAKLNRILMNILSNAVKYTPIGGNITFMVQQIPQVSSAATNIAKFRFMIQDDGIGMSEDYQKIIFDTFTREENGDTNIKGTGLGMAIVKNLVDLMGGYITIQSKLGHGSTFIVELSFKIHLDENYDTFWQEHHLMRTLAVDSERDVCTATANAARLGGLRMECSVGGEDAIKKVELAREENQQYDLIIVEQNMPYLSGEDTIKKIREITDDTKPMILLTSYDRSEGEMGVKPSGADGFLQKPFFLSVLKDTIEQLMGKEEKRESAVKSTVLEGLHALVVEDYELNAEILQSTLGMYGITSELCTDGKQALNRMKESERGEFDLILMDIQMPVMNGYDATRGIREIGNEYTKTIPIIAMSANAFAEDIQKAYDAGMDRYLTKPVDIKAVEETLTEIIVKRNGE